MSYNPHLWDDGDNLTAESLNHMEQGIFDNDKHIEELGEETAAVIREIRDTIGAEARMEVATVGCTITTSGSTVDNIAVSAPNNASFSVGKVVLSRGVWICTYGLAYGSNATGYRAAQLHTSSTYASSRQAMVLAAANGDATRIQSARLITVTGESATYYLNGKHNSGAALTVYPTFKAIKIA